MRDRFIDRLRAFALLMALAWPACGPAQPVFKEPEQPDLADLIADVAKDFGEAINKRDELLAERRARIAELERQLTACGRCAEREALQAELARWRAADRALAEAERAALAAVGVGQYASIDELKAGLAAGLAQWSAQLEAEHQRRSDIDRAHTAINFHCQAQVYREVPAHCLARLSSSSKLVLSRRVDTCGKAFNAGLVYTNDLTVRELCRKTREPKACIQQNSPLARMGEAGKQALLQIGREQREAGVESPAQRQRRLHAEELAQRRVLERERNERLAAATTPQEKQRIRAEHAQRDSERLAAWRADRADERREQQACELN